MTEKCYSSCGERYYSDVQSATYDCEVGAIIYEGDAVEPCASEFAPDADWVLEYMNEQACDNLGECAEDWPDVTKEAKKELDAFLKDWAVRNCPVNFYRVENVRDYVVTEEDLV